jgi:hypothetical protein
MTCNIKHKDSITCGRDIPVMIVTNQDMYALVSEEFKGVNSDNEK